VKDHRNTLLVTKNNIIITIQELLKKLKVNNEESNRLGNELYRKEEELSDTHIKIDGYQPQCQDSTHHLKKHVESLDRQLEKLKGSFHDIQELGKLLQKTLIFLKYVSDWWEGIYFAYLLSHMIKGDDVPSPISPYAKNTKTFHRPVEGRRNVEI
jgi:polyhydroxyalkanoate synthesis regulator phasin